MRKRSRRGSSSPPSQLPLDLILEIAARSDPATLVRCAAACKDLRRHVADPAFRTRLRLRHADHCFVASLLRGHLVETRGDDNQHLVRYDTGRRLAAAGSLCFPSDSGEPSRLHEPMAARDGLVLVRTTGSKQNVKEEELRVCSPATGRSQIIPRGATFHGQYVLLVGDGGGGVGRAFQVLKVSPVLSRRSRHRCLQIQTFSSVHGAWGPRIRVRAPHDVHGGWLRRTPLVANEALYWLCRSDTSYYVFKLKLDVRAAAAEVTATKLPASFHGAQGMAAAGRKNMLLATMPASCGNQLCLCVLVADGGNISVWSSQSRGGSPAARWSERPEAVIKIGAVMDPTSWVGRCRLEWFAERSGVVLMVAPGSQYFWLDLRSRQIFRWPLGPWTVESAMNCPYEMDLSSWVPTFCISF
ncbi:unnamed protein product [Urochloa decumbens]|uniref:F-box domain-containing protein n=1 Tax=Urochloa decumbens TaxID=240449 RepID=A0ABC8VTQ1_9POAL